MDTLKEIEKNNVIENDRSDKLFSTLSYITKSCPDVVIGGSISFIARGFLSREPNDIDIFISQSTSLLKMGLLDLNREDIGSDTITDIDGKKISRTPMIMNGVKVCVFKVALEYLNYELVEYRGILIKAQLPQFGIIAKKIYAQRNPKHQKDLEEIEKLWQIII